MSRHEDFQAPDRRDDCALSDHELLVHINRRLAAMTPALQDVVNSVAQEGTIETSIEALVTQLVGLYQGAAASADPQSAIEAVSTQLQSNITNMTAAVVAGTAALPVATPATQAAAAALPAKA